MLRISKLTDYGTVVLAHLAAHQAAVCSAADVAQATGIAPPTVSKLLKLLARAGLVNSTRGASGPVSITECSASDGDCEHEDVCSVGSAWQRINVAIRRALRDVTLNDLIRANSPLPTFRFAGLPISIEKAMEEHGN